MNISETIILQTIPTAAKSIEPYATEEINQTD